MLFNQIMSTIYTKKITGFTAVEILVVLSIMALLSTIGMSAFISSRKSHALKNDRDTIVETLSQAHNQTLASKNASAYGVNFASSRITLFTGTTYSSSDSNNKIFDLTSGNSISTALAGNGSNIIFNRITGETDQSGTVTISSSATSTMIRIYKTGTIEVAY